MAKSYIEIEVDLSEFDDAALEEEVRERGLPRSRHAAQDAINQIRRGDYLEAITTLEREFFPKWGSVYEVQAAYDKAVGR